MRCRSVDRWFHDEPSVRRFVSTSGIPHACAFCYEAGPTGYELARLLAATRGRHRGDRPFADPGHTRSQGQDRQERRPSPRPALSGRRADRGAHPDAGRRGDPGPGPHPSRSRHRPHPVPAPALQVPAAPRRGLSEAGCSGRWRTSLAPPGATSTIAALGQTYSHYRAIVSALDAHLAAVESDLKPYLDHRSLRRSGRPAERLSRRHRARRADLVGRGLRLAALSQSRPRSWAFAGSCPLSTRAANRIVEGRITKAGNTHLRSPAGRVRLVLSAPPGGRATHQQAPGALLARDRRPSLDGPAPSLRQVPPAGRTQDSRKDRRHRHRPRAHRLPLGRDGRLR